jgi:hypothetical protein
VRREAAALISISPSTVFTVSYPWQGYHASEERRGSVEGENNSSSNRLVRCSDIHVNISSSPSFFTNPFTININITQHPVLSLPTVFSSLAAGGCFITRLISGSQALLVPPEHQTGIHHHPLEACPPPNIDNLLKLSRSHSFIPDHP